MNILWYFICFMTPFSLYQVNSSPPSAAYMRHWAGSSLVQVMACRLFGAKPLPEPMLAFCLMVSWEHNWNGILSFSFKKMQLKMSCAKMAREGVKQSIKRLLDTWVDIGAKSYHKSVWCTLMSNTHMDVILWSVCYFCAYCTTYYIYI